MKEHRLPLTPTEEALVAQIDLRLSHHNHAEGHAAYLANRQPILELLKSLTARDIIPSQRLRYWNDPYFKPGQIKGSRKQLFERNGCVGEDIYTHPHFIKHLRYILLGADLPRDVMEAFEEKVGNPEWVSHSDALDLGKFARQLVRKNGLVPSHACEEFFKLALDLELDVDSALRIRSIVKETR